MKIKMLLFFFLISINQFLALIANNTYLLRVFFFKFLFTYYCCFSFINFYIRYHFYSFVVFHFIELLYKQFVYYYYYYFNKLFVYLMKEDKFFFKDFSSIFRIGEYIKGSIRTRIKIDKLFFFSVRFLFQIQS